MDYDNLSYDAKWDFIKESGDYIILTGVDSENNKHKAIVGYNGKYVCRLNFEKHYSNKPAKSTLHLSGSWNTADIIRDHDMFDPKDKVGSMVKIITKVYNVHMRVVRWKKTDNIIVNEKTGEDYACPLLLKMYMDKPPAFIIENPLYYLLDTVVEDNKYIAVRRTVMEGLPE